MTRTLIVTRLERLIGRVLRTGVVTATVCFAVGLLLTLAGGAAASASTIFLNAGVIVLLATPVTRVLVSVLEYVSQRDWLFVTLTTIVLAELIGSVVLALAFNTRV